MKLVRVGQIKLDFPTLRKHKELLFIDQITGKEVKFRTMVTIDLDGFVCIEVPDDIFENGEMADG